MDVIRKVLAAHTLLSFPLYFHHVSPLAGLPHMVANAFKNIAALVSDISIVDVPSARFFGMHPY